MTISGSPKKDTPLVSSLVFKHHLFSETKKVSFVRYGSFGRSVGLGPPARCPFFYRPEKNRALTLILTSLLEDLVVEPWQNDVLSNSTHSVALNLTQIPRRKWAKGALWFPLGANLLYIGATWSLEPHGGKQVCPCWTCSWGVRKASE